MRTKRFWPYLFGVTLVSMGSLTACALSGTSGIAGFVFTSISTVALLFLTLFVSACYKTGDRTKADSGTADSGISNITAGRVGPCLSPPTGAVGPCLSLPAGGFYACLSPISGGTGPYPSAGTDVPPPTGGMGPCLSPPVSGTGPCLSLPWDANVCLSPPYTDDDAGIDDPQANNIDIPEDLIDPSIDITKPNEYLRRPTLVEQRLNVIDKMRSRLPSDVVRRLEAKAKTRKG